MITYSGRCRVDLAASSRCGSVDRAAVRSSDEEGVTIQPYRATGLPALLPAL